MALCPLDIYDNLILDGAKFIDLTFQSVKSIDGSDMPMCKNCQHTFIEYMKQLLGEKR